VSSTPAPQLVMVTDAVTIAGTFVSGIVTTVVAAELTVATLPFATKASVCPAGPAGPRGPVAPRSCFTTDGEIWDRLVMT
jgi:hypothetical protein